MDDQVRNIKRIMARYDRPFYLYRQKVMARQAEILLTNLKGFDFLYSIKTNPFPPVVRQAAASGFGADAASAAEVDSALAAKMAPDDIFYSSPGKTRLDLEFSLGKAHIIADSLQELEVLNQLALGREKPMAVGLRLNPNFSLEGGPGQSAKFGVDVEQVYDKRPWLEQLTNIEISGLHIHLRSQVLDTPALARYYARVFEMSLALKRDLGWRLDYLNFGGGLGIVYSRNHDEPLNIPALSGECRKLWKRYQNEIKARLLIETGRFLVGEAGSYFTPIVDINVSRGKKYLIVRNGLNGFLRPSLAGLIYGRGPGASGSTSAEPLYTGPEAFVVSLVGREEGGQREVVDVVGNLCTATDVLAANLSLPRARVGDIIEVTMAGSYAFSLSPLLFSSHQPPLEIFLDEQDNLITR